MSVGHRFEFWASLARASTRGEEGMKPTKLTEKFVQSLEPGAKPYIVRDTGVKGLMVAVNKRSKSYKIQKDLWTGDLGQRRLIKTVRRTIGSVDDLTVKDARSEAMRLIASIHEGEDPNHKASEDEQKNAASWTIERMYDEYVLDMRARECSESNIANIVYRRDRYLSNWKPMLICSIGRSDCRERHRIISKNNGKIAANQTFREYRAAYNIALRVTDDPDSLPDNPVKAVTFNKENRSERIILPDELPDWWERLSKLKNPLRRKMHEFGVFSALRPRYLVSIEREWIKLDEGAIIFPKMKAGRSFALPLSEHMKTLIGDALEYSQMFFPGARWLFPSRSAKTAEVIPTCVWRERKMPGETGHVLRHTHRTVAQRIKVDPINRRLLLDQTVPGIDGVYVHEKALFDRLLHDQEMVSAELLSLMGRQ